MTSKGQWNQANTVIHDEDVYPIPEAIGLCLQFVGFIENIVVVYLLFSIPKLRKRAHEFFILCLSFSDLLACSTNLVYYTPIFAQTDLSSETFCKMVYTGWILFYCSSLYLAFVISLERSNAVKFQTRSMFDGKYKYYVTILPITLLIIYILVIVDNVETTGSYHRCKLERMYSYNNMFIMLVSTQLIIILPLVTLTILLYGTAVFRLSRLLRRHQRDAAERQRLRSNVNAIPSNYTHLRLKTKPANLKPLSSHLHGDYQCKNLTDIHCHCNTDRKAIDNVRHLQSTSFIPDQTIKHKIRCTKQITKLKTALITVLIILVSLFIAFIPHSVFQLLKLANIQSLVMQLVTRLLLIAHPVVNPILYVWRIKTIRKEMILRKVI